MPKITLLILLLPLGILNAQMPQKALSVGITPLSYTGDLNSAYTKWGAGFTTSLILNRAKRVNGEFQFNYGTVWGNNPNYPTQGITNNYFKSHFFTLGYQLRINLLSKENYKLYFSPGISLFRFNPKDQEGNNLKDDISTRENNEEYSNVSLALPIKIGGMYFLNNGMGISYEFGWYNPTTDYLDNISNLGTRERNDNIMFHKISVLFPLKPREN